VGALQLGSEEGIGASLISAVSSRGGAKLHAEDPAAAFFKAASQSALAHHVEEVTATERYSAALAGPDHLEFHDSDDGRRLDGTPTVCVVRYKVVRSWREEAFELFAPVELRGVLAAVVEQLGEGGAGGASLELLKPFKMAHASPRVFWNLARLHGGDVELGLRTLLPNADWGFLAERERKGSDKAVANAAQHAEMAEEREARARRKREREAEREGARAAEAAGGAAGVVDLTGDGDESGGAEPLAAVVEGGESEVGADAGAGDEEDEAEAEPADDGADGWQALGVKAMKEGEYEYACSCLDRALKIRIDALGGEEHDASLAEAWYLHGSALLRRAQRLALCKAGGGGGGDGGDGGDGDGDGDSDGDSGDCDGDSDGDGDGDGGGGGRKRQRNAIVIVIVINFLESGVLHCNSLINSQTKCWLFH